MEIIKSLFLGCENLDGEKKYQYLYRINSHSVSLRYLEVRGGNFMWEVFGFYLEPELNQRFDTQDEAEAFIIESLLGDDLKDLVEWKIAKQNMIIQE